MRLVLAVATLWAVASVILVFLLHLRDCVSAWREPVLRHPVLLFESDDWGPGPLSQAQALNRLTSVLRSYEDSRGRHPIMTLGVVLSVPDPEAIATGRSEPYPRLTLAAPSFEPLRKAIFEGVASGVMYPQLHGMEHFWPPALLAASRENRRVRDWLRKTNEHETEDLPPALQSRWIDASCLPSRPIPVEQIRRAAEQEVRAFAEVFGRVPQVAVPPTFVWSAVVEEAWRAAGVRIVVTPGRRYESRDEAGQIVAKGPRIHNGQRSRSGVIYLVRDEYFEPVKGHKREGGLVALDRKTKLGRPTLLEMHRFNFTGSRDSAERSIEELGKLLGSALDRYADLRFLSTEELVDQIQKADPGLVDKRLSVKVSTWLLRLREIPRFHRLARLTGLIVPATLLFLLVSWLTQRSSYSERGAAA